MMLRAKFFAIPLLALTAASVAAPAHARADASSAEATTAEADAAADAMNEEWNIVQNVTSSPEHKTLIKAIAAAGLTDTLSGAGPFTIFAPTDAAFGAVPAPMTEYLMNPVNKPALVQLLTYHVVPGHITAEQLYTKIEAGGGKAVLTTVEGQPLTFTEVQGNIKVDGTQGSTGYVTQADVEQSNGVIHVLNGVLMPKLTPVTPPAAAAVAPVDGATVPAADPAAPADAATPADPAAPADAAAPTTPAADPATPAVDPTS